MWLLHSDERIFRCRVAARAWHHRGMRAVESVSSGKMPSSREDRGLRAAIAYYLEGQTLDAVARELQVSRATVSRLLARARAAGIVETKVFTPGASAFCTARARASPRSTELRRRQGVETQAVPLPGEITVDERGSRPADAAAEALRRVVSAHAVLAVAWGSTTHSIRLHRRPKGVT